MRPKNASLKASLEAKKTNILAYGGNYANLKDVGVGNFMVTVFLLGVGGPEMKRRNKVSRNGCLKKYLGTSLPHF